MQHTKLHAHTTGDGPELVLIHGWALHSGVWNSLVAPLAQHFRVTCVDLPGHGYSGETPMPTSLARVAHLVREAVPARAVWLGWSLGGLVCLRAALDFPMQLRALILVSSTPRFVTAADWPHAVPPVQLRQFARELRRDYRHMLQRFLALQVRGDAAARATLRTLRATLLARDEPQLASLTAGLEILRNSDMRAELGCIRLPTLVMTGEYDRLAPPQAARALTAAIRGAAWLGFARAAHAPFVSQPLEFIAALNHFMEKLPTLTST